MFYVVRRDYSKTKENQVFPFRSAIFVVTRENLFFFFCRALVALVLSRIDKLLKLKVIVI